MLYTLVLLILWVAYWSAESGASLPWSSKWQDYAEWFSELPEGILAATTATISIVGLINILLITNIWVAIIVWLLAAIAAYAGKQSATRAYLRWVTHNDTSDRDSTLRPLYRILAKPFGWVSGDEGYAWIVAFVKGFIMTPFMGGFLGGIFFMLGHEIGSHAKGRLPGDSNMWKELSSGVGLAVAFIIWLLLTGVI